MASGVPVVASDRGSIPEVVGDGDAGFVCDPSGPGSFVDKVLLLLGDRALRERLGVGGRERAEKLFTWERCVAATRRVYEQTLDAWRRRRGGRAA
jgi:glycosyltransferase involved in cell wall biosynthesis